MQLSDCRTAELLPAWMRDEPDDAALAAAVDAVVREAAGKAAELTLWDRIDKLPEERLDELAWALDITWWDGSAPIEAKRSMVKESDLVHRSLGTRAAVESVAASYLGDSSVVEWDEYGGQPHHFKLATSNLELLSENRNRIIGRVDKAKRLSSRMDGIIIDFTGPLPLESGFATRVCTHEVHRQGIRSIWLLVGQGISLSEHLTVDMGEELPA